MDIENELYHLTKENETFRQIIKTQQNTIIRLVDYFILQKKPEHLNSGFENTPR